MKKNFLLYCSLLCLLLLQRISFAQEVQAYALIDTSKIRIGEQAKIDLFINYKGDKKTLKIKWPAIGDSIASKVEVVNVSQIDTTIPDKNDPKNIQQHQTIYVTSFDSGMWAIPSFDFIVNDDTARPVSTQTLSLEVMTIPTDTSEVSIKDIKPVFDEPSDWKEYLPYIYWGAAILAALALLYYIIYRVSKSRKQKPVEEIRKPRIPPHITALQNLEKIREAKLWQEGKTKEYYTAVTDVLRVYIEGRYDVMAMELTSEEIMQVMKSQVIDSVSKDRLQQILRLADMVKFAKALPIDVENEMTLNNAFEFVKGTLREEITPENSQFNTTQP
ncbi:MAG: hypothetical protein K0S33_723 [Bacteroidetes bacterium]|nr:hypothetical protein [Bacteroidota bacterium]